MSGAWAHWVGSTGCPGGHWEGSSGVTDGPESARENSGGSEGMAGHLGGFWGHWGDDGSTVGQYFVCWGWAQETRG